MAAPSRENRSAAQMTGGDMRYVSGKWLMNGPVDAPTRTSKRIVASSHCGRVGRGDERVVAMSSRNGAKSTTPIESPIHQVVP